MVMKVIGGVPKLWGAEKPVVNQGILNTATKLMSCFRLAQELIFDHIGKYFFEEPQCL